MEINICNGCGTDSNVKKRKAFENLIFSHYYYQCDNCNKYYNDYECAIFE